VFAALHWLSAVGASLQSGVFSGGLPVALGVTTALDTTIFPAWAHLDTIIEAVVQSAAISTF